MTANGFAARHPRLAELFGIDLRTLALFRVALGSVLLVILLRMIPDIEGLYTDFGAVPRIWAIEADSHLRWSLHFANGSWLYAALLLGIQILAALMFILGWRTRAATIVSFVLWGSLMNRNVVVLIGGDLLMACLLFWAMFLPLGARFSVDAALARNPPPARQLHVSPASAGLLLQVMSVYFFSAFLKSAREWVPEYTAVYYALQLDGYATPLGHWLLNFPGLLKALSAFVWWLELLGPVLIFSPLLLSPLRTSMMALFMAMHIGFIFCLEIGHFPFISLCSLSTFLGGWFWDWRAARHAARQPQPPRIYYDRDCGFCYKMCRLIQQFLILPRAPITPAQDEPEPGRLLEEHYSWVVYDAQGQAHLKWMAFAVLLKASPLFGWSWPLARRLDAPGRRVYDLVGAGRGRLSALSARLLPEREVRWELGRLGHGTAAAFVVAVASWNFATIDVLPERTFDLLSPVFRPLRIDQWWNMFAPHPLKNDGWMVIPAKLADGTEFDLLRPERGSPPDMSRPGNYSQTHRNIRWHTMIDRLYEKTYHGYRLHFGRYLCRSWNRDKMDDPARAGRRLMTFEMIYYVEPTAPDYITSPVKPFTLWKHECFPREESSTAAG